jgi:hypothetical protein
MIFCPINKKFNEGNEANNSREKGKSFVSVSPKSQRYKSNKKTHKREEDCKNIFYNKNDPISVDDSDYVFVFLKFKHRVIGR